MDKPNRKLTWVHVTYHSDGSIELLFATERWKDGSYIGKHLRSVWLGREHRHRMGFLIRVISSSPSVKHTIFAWDGYSVCWERVTPFLLG